MCMICHQSPCHPRLLNAPDPPEFYTCQYCKEPITAGDEYLEIDGVYYHLEDCASDAAMDILLNQCGATKGVAEVDDQWP